jgi:hypothetical protein
MEGQGFASSNRGIPRLLRNFVALELVNELGEFLPAYTEALLLNAQLDNPGS